MTIKYYLKHCLWGLIGCGYLTYLILTDLNSGDIYPAYAPYMPYIASYLAVSAVIFPFAFYTTEQLSLKNGKSTFLKITLTDLSQYFALATISLLFLA